MRSVFDAKPCRVRARVLCRKTDTGLLYSAEYLNSKLKCICKFETNSLENCISEAQSYLNENTENRLSGVFYSAYSLLEDSIISKNMKRIESALDNFDNLNVKSIELRVSALGDGSFSLSEEYILCELIKNEQDPNNIYDVVAEPCELNSAQYSISQLKKAITVINELSNDLYGETLCHLTEILIVKSNQINAASSFKSFGVVFMRELESEQDWTTYLEHLIHESAHHLVFSIWHSQRLIEKDKGILLCSPLRPDPRPISAVFHAAGVLSRIIFILGLAYDSGKYKNLKRTAKYNFPNTESLLNQFHDAFYAIESNAILSETGNKLLCSFKNLAQEYNRNSTLFIGREVSQNG